MTKASNVRSPSKEEEEAEQSYDDSSNTNSDLATSTSSGQHGLKSQARDDTFVQGETMAVNRSKCMVYFALLCAAAAVSAVTYVFLTKEEENAMRIEVRRSFRHFHEHLHWLNTSSSPYP
jgi:cobalamin biosynthesis Mg chelatase CobN